MPACMVYDRENLTFSIELHGCSAQSNLNNLCSGHSYVFCMDHTYVNGSLLSTVCTFCVDCWLGSHSESTDLPGIA